ncbi:hypothetical protein Tco_0799173 [Tanacetum coccineum]
MAKKRQGFGGKIRPKVSQFCEIYNSVRDRHQSGSCDNTVYQEAELEYHTIYNAPFTLTECWKILKDHPKWKKAQEIPAPIGQDRAKKKGSSSGARSKTSIAGDPSLVDALLKRELKLEERKRQEQGELERLRIAQRDKELDLQQKMFEFQQQQKFDEGLKYYNEDHDHLNGRALSTALFLKKKNKERCNLDY